MNPLIRLMTFTRTYSFKSVYSIDKLYPNSNIKLTTPTFVPEDPNVKFTGYIPVEQLTITYSRSGGPGGQNVNVTNSKVDLRFNLQKASWMSEEIKEKLLLREKNRINKDGYFIVKSEVTRFQHLNLADALEKLRAMIRKSVSDIPAPPSPESEEMHRKRMLKAARQRIFEKRIKSERKQAKNVSVDF